MKCLNKRENRELLEKLSQSLSNFELVQFKMKITSLLFSSAFLLISTIQAVNAVILKCDFTFFDDKSSYTCCAKNLQTSLDDRVVTAIEGHHLENKTNNDVKHFMAEEQYCPYLPLGLGEHFKNLETNMESIINFHDLIQEIKAKCQDPSIMPDESKEDQEDEGHEPFGQETFCRKRYFVIGIFCVFALALCVLLVKNENIFYR
jgi:hypothetical protein